jgi:hypothetical protein
MDESLDIFRLESDGTALWRGTAEGFDAAMARVKALASRSPGDYMIYSPATGTKTRLNLNNVTKRQSRSQSHAPDHV